MKSLTQYLTEAFEKNGVRLTDIDGKEWPIMTLDAALAVAEQHDRDLKNHLIMEAMRECVV